MKSRILIFSMLMLLLFSCGKEETQKLAYLPHVALKYPSNEGTLFVSQSLQWDGLDYGGQSLTFDLYVGTDLSNMVKVLDKTVSTESCCSDLKLQEGKTYYWKVAAINSNGEKSSDVWKFTLVEDVSSGQSGDDAVVSVYSDCNYGGTRVDLLCQSYNLSRIIANGGADNANASLKVKYGYNVTMYENDNFQGASLVKANDDDCLDNDNFVKKASSYVVAKTPVWKMVTLVLTRTEMDVNEKHYSYTMSDERRDAYVKTANALPQLFKEWTRNQAVVEMDVFVVSEPVTQMQSYGDGGFYPHTQKITDIMNKYVADHTYGSLFLCIDMGPVPKGSNWIGLGMGPCNGSKGATYACMTVTGAGAWVHEWLHGAESWFDNELPGLQVPDPHENGRFGYTSDVTPNWDIWYKALLSGEDLIENGKVYGYVGECWKYGGPNAVK